METDEKKEESKEVKEEAMDTKEEAGLQKEADKEEKEEKIKSRKLFFDIDIKNLSINVSFIFIYKSYVNKLIMDNFR